MAQEQSHGDGAEVLTFVERFAAEMVEAGMPRMPGRVFAALMASEHGALTSAELSERLQVSPAAVSGAVRYLAQVGMISRERDPGSRRERYRLHNDQWYETFTRRDAIIGRWEHTLRAGVEALGPGTQAGSRLEETAEFFAFLQKELHSMMARWRSHKEQLREHQHTLREHEERLGDHEDDHEDDHKDDHKEQLSG